MNKRLSQDLNELKLVLLIHNVPLQTPYNYINKKIEDKSTNMQVEEKNEIKDNNKDSSSNDTEKEIEIFSKEAKQIKLK